MPRPLNLSPNAIPIAREIYRRMVDLEMSRPELERLAGLKRGYVWDLFRGKSQKAGSEEIYAIARVLACTVEELSDPTTPVVSGDTESSDSFDQGRILPLLPGEPALLTIWRQISKESQEAMFLMILNLAVGSAGDKRGSKSGNKGSRRK